MSKKKFTGKIRTDPWEALARGPKEVMASIWGEYLQELLEGPPKSGRNRLIRQDIEDTAGYRQIYQEWRGMSPEKRAESWRRLVRTARERYEVLKDTCVRCGECCEKSSPTLLLADLPLLTQEVLTWNDVYTLRPGEQVTSRDGIVTILEEERLKVRELPGSRQCYFYQAATQRCRLYEQRPEQCRRQQCWGEPPPPIQSAELLTRRHLFADIPKVWELITAHQNRCDLFKMRQILTEVASGQDDTWEPLFEALHFDHFLRRMLISDWELKPAATDLLLGRPLVDFLRTCGVKASFTPEGVFRLEPCQPSQ